MKDNLTHFHLQEAYRLPGGSYTKPHWDEWFDIKIHNAVCEEEVDEALKCIGEWYEVAEGEIETGNTVWWSDPDGNKYSGPRKVTGLNQHMVIFDNGTEAHYSECTALPLYRRIADVSSTGAPDPDPKLPYTENVPLVMVQDDQCEHLQALMHSDDIRNVITCERYPTVFNDPGYPDIVVVWDSGEGPHNPYTYHDEALADGEWLRLGVYPKEVWDLVREIAEYKGLTDRYAVFWLKGEDRA